uniref:Uncharacterized protein n=1 Tax=Anguilla anguilla TaxID=7936 RepID=A0A0E9VDN6_ANGAN
MEELMEQTQPALCGESASAPKQERAGNWSLFNAKCGKNWDTIKTGSEDELEVSPVSREDRALCGYQIINLKNPRV